MIWYRVTLLTPTGEVKLVGSWLRDVPHYLYEATRVNVGLNRSFTIEVRTEDPNGK